MLSLSAKLDRSLLAARFTKRKRLHIPNVLNSNAASRLHRCLDKETTFNLVVNEREKVFDLSQADQSRMSRIRMKALRTAADQGARWGFQFLYENHRMTDAGEPYRDPSHFLADVVVFLNGKDFLDFVHRVTGDSEIRFADAQATRYRPGHFLTTHNDDITGKNRRLAYVLNMTPAWRADWGGVLLFLDEQGNVSEGFSPTFNALNIFSVPQRHLVSQVATFAEGARYAITGWLRS